MAAGVIDSPLMPWTAATLALLSVLTASPEDALVGRWGIIDEKPRVFLDLPPNGLGRVAFGSGLWSADEHELRLVTPDKPKEPYAFPYSLQEGKLKIKLDRDTLTFERLEAPAEYHGPKAREQPQLLGHDFAKAGADVYLLAKQDGGFMAVGSSSWVLVPEARAESFQALAPGVGKDAQAVYCAPLNGTMKGSKASRLTQADAKTFHVLIARRFRPYFADARNVFNECRRVVKRERAGASKLTSFDSKTFALADCELLKDASGIYALVPLPSAPDPSRVKEWLQLEDQLSSSQLSVYERVSADVDALAAKGCVKVPEPSPLKQEDLTPPAH